MRRFYDDDKDNVWGCMYELVKSSTKKYKKDRWIYMQLFDVLDKCNKDNSACQKIIG